MLRSEWHGAARVGSGHWAADRPYATLAGGVVSWIRDSIFRARPTEPHFSWSWVLILTRVIVFTKAPSKKRM